MNILAIDTETTGLWDDPDGPPAVVELAAVPVERTGRRWVVDPRQRAFSTLVDPGKPIPVTARAIHHISDEMVRGSPPLDEAVRLLSRRFPRLEGKAAHNADYDARFFGEEGRWICTWRCANHVWPDLPSHSNQVIRYALPGLNEEIERQTFTMKLPPHRALPDAWVTAHVLARLLADRETPEALLELTGKPILQRTIRFGKHRGERWENVPVDYLRWMLGQAELKPEDWDSDVIHTATHWYRRAR